MAASREVTVVAIQFTCANAKASNLNKAKSTVLALFGDRGFELCGASATLDNPAGTGAGRPGLTHRG